MAFESGILDFTVFFFQFSTYIKLYVIRSALEYLATFALNDIDYFELEVMI